MKKIPIAGPSFTEKEIAYVTDAVTNSWYENANVYIEKFQTSFAKYTGRKYAIALEASQRDHIAYNISKRSVSLPSAFCLTRKDVETVCWALIKIFKNKIAA